MTKAKTWEWNPPITRPGVYLLWCEASRKGYVGLSRAGLLKRLRQHERGNHGEKLRRAIAKHGMSSFIFVPLYVAFDSSDLHDVEADLISAWGTAGQTGYNAVLRATGRGAYGPEVSEQRRAWANTPDGRSAMERAWTAGHSPKARRARSESLRRYRNSPEGRAATLARGRPEPLIAARRAHAQTPKGRADQRWASFKGSLKRYPTATLTNVCRRLLIERPAELLAAITPLVDRFVSAGYEIPGVDVREETR